MGWCCRCGRRGKSGLSSEERAPSSGRSAFFAPSAAASPSGRPLQVVLRPAKFPQAERPPPPFTHTLTHTARDPSSPPPTALKRSPPLPEPALASPAGHPPRRLSEAAADLPTAGAPRARLLSLWAPALGHRSRGRKVGCGGESTPPTPPPHFPSRAPARLRCCLAGKTLLRVQIHPGSV